AHAAGDHDGLVVAAYLSRDLLLEGAEIAGQVGTPEFVVEGGAADGRFDHDLQGRGNPRRAPDPVPLPRLHEPGNLEVGDRIAGQSRLGFPAAAGRPLVADLAS